MAKAKAAGRVASLSVHRNTVEARRKRNLAKDIQAGAAKMVRDNDIRAYAVVGIGSDGRAYAIWDTGAILPMRAFADTVASILRDDISRSGVQEDWRQNLTTRGSEP